MIARRTVVFAGPSVGKPMRLANPDMDWRGPAQAGDGLALLVDLPHVVVLIDGLFDQTQAIRHKELLVLLAQGVHLVGGASMGALRAAELAPFGMQGVGRIFEAYQRGRLERDDEVALLHAPAELDWAPITTPLVNIRATLLAAVRQGVVPSPVARPLLEAAKGVFYRDRTWEAVISNVRTLRSGADPALSRFEAWLPGGEVNLKAADASACIEAALRIGSEPGRRRPMPPRTIFTDRLAAASGSVAIMRAFDQCSPGTSRRSAPARRDGG